MGIIKIFGQGLVTSYKKRRIIVYLWLLNFLTAILVVAPFYALLQKEFSRSLSGERLFAGGEFLWLGDLIYKYQNAAPLFIGWLIAGAILYVLLQIFFHGGVIGRIATWEERATLAGFFGDCGRYFWRFFRVFLIFLVSMIIMFGLLGRLISAPFSLWAKNAPTQWVTLSASSLRLLFFLLLFSIVRMFFDYVKVTLVVTGSRKVLRTTLANFPFLGRRFFKAWALYLLVGLIFIVLTLSYLGAAKILPKTGLVLAVILFLWQQAYILVRSWTTVLFFATDYHFLKAHQPAPS